MADNDVAQCGYCQPGQIMAATAKIKQIKAQGHPRIRKAVKEAAAKM